MKIERCCLKSFNLRVLRFNGGRELKSNVPAKASKNQHMGAHESEAIEVIFAS